MSCGEHRGCMSLVRAFVFRESCVPVNAIEAGPRRRFDFRRDLCKLKGQRPNEFFHWFLYAFLVLCLVRLEPVPVVVPFQTSQEAKSGFRKGWEMWAVCPSIVDIRRIAV